MQPLNKGSLSKAKLREILLARRQQISFLERQTAANDAVAVLLKNNIFQKAQEIACYYPMKNEFDCLPIIKEIWRTKKNCYLPVITDIGNTKTSLEFILYQEDTILRPNRYNIPEPISDIQIKPENLDLVLLPLLGFDKQGNRLGMGAGYYDRTFDFFKQTKKPVLLGLAYESQCVSELPHDPWDVKLQGVMTEKNIFIF